MEPNEGWINQSIGRHFSITALNVLATPRLLSPPVGMGIYALQCFQLDFVVTVAWQSFPLWLHIQDLVCPLNVCHNINLYDGRSRILLL